LIDPALAAASAAPGKSGYSFAYASGTGTYTVNANPLTPGATGVRFFFTDQSNVIRADTAAATVSSPAI
jgi:hypothetical protein